MKKLMLGATAAVLLTAAAPAMAVLIQSIDLTRATCMRS